MTEPLAIEAKNLLPIREAVVHVSYSKDYVTRLAREGKIIARWIGRQWFVDLGSLKAYEESARIELELRKQKLSDERKRERELRDALTENAAARVSAGSDKSQIVVAATASVLVVCAVLTSVFVYSSVDSARLNPAALLQAGVFTTSDPAPPVAWQPEEMVVPHFTISSAPTATKTTAVVLLPTGTPEGQATVTEFFSDNVTSRTLEDGTQVLVVSDEGSDTEEYMPFVAVPVPHEPAVIDDDQTAYE